MKFDVTLNKSTELNQIILEFNFARNLKEKIDRNIYQNLNITFLFSQFLY